MQPKPYWEPAEDKFIVHFTKVIVDALGAEAGWDKPIAKAAGIPVEILPLSRPYSLYAGNLFTGQIFGDGKPVPHAEVEVEFWGKGTTKAPTDSHIRQVIKSDPNGVFSYAMPKAGWWGFSAIMEGPETIKHEGKDRKVEIGAVIWGTGLSYAIGDTMHISEGILGARVLASGAALTVAGTAIGLKKMDYEKSACSGASFCGLFHSLTCSRTGRSGCGTSGSKWPLRPSAWVVRLSCDPRGSFLARDTFSVRWAHNSRRKYL